MFNSNNFNTMKQRLDIREINLKEEIKRISEIESIEEIYIFGSRAYKTGSLRSDIDLLVYAPSGIRQDQILPIINQEKALDIFETTNKFEARSFANDSRLRRTKLIENLDAILLWTKESGFTKEITEYNEIKVLKDIDFKMSIMPLYTKEEEAFYHKYGYSAVFVIMPFKDELKTIYDVIVAVFSKYGYIAIRADTKEFADDVWLNIKIYLDCCNIAVAVFDQNEQNSYNPNVALEAGYMMAKDCKICFLKDKNLAKLPTDLISKLYKEYDPNEIEETVTKQLEAWIKDHL